MYRNLKAEQARAGLTNEQMAGIIGKTRATFENKMKSGEFTVSECLTYCARFGCCFDYLFAKKLATNEKAGE